jgi:hypothetical protein
VARNGNGGGGCATSGKKRIIYLSEPTTARALVDIQAIVAKGKSGRASSSRENYFHVTIVVHAEHLGIGMDVQRKKDRCDQEKDAKRSTKRKQEKQANSTQSPSIYCLSWRTFWVDFS